MRTTIAIALLILTACGDNIAGSAGGPGDGDGDGDADASVDAGCETFWAPAQVDPCALPDAPEPAITIPAGETWTYDTSDGSLTDDAGGMTTPVNQMIALTPPVRFLYVEALTIEAGGTLIVDGEHPLIAGASGSIEIAGLLDLTSKNEDPRAGSNPAGCPTDPPGAGDTAIGGSGGGGGAGGQGAGGTGGKGDEPNVAGGDGGAGGEADATTPVSPIGGCPGAIGGDGVGGDSGAAGSGGGAVQVSAQVMVAVTANGVINAGGGGGVGASGGQGGGGGAGAGGYIRLDSEMIELADSAAVTANGGGGGAGANALPGGDGGNGQPNANGGVGGLAATMPAGDGGSGGDLGDVAGNTPDAVSAGAGGGGGGAGYVIVPAGFTPSGTAILSPAPIEAP